MFSYFYNNSDNQDDDDVHQKISNLTTVINYLQTEINSLKERVILLENQQETREKETFPLLKSIFSNLTNKQLLELVPKMDNESRKNTKKELVNALLITLKRKIPSRDFNELFDDRFKFTVEVLELLQDNKDEAMEEWNLLTSED
jgi:hypothetical protein